MAQLDPLYLEVAHVALSVAERHGFALGGGLGLIAHGVVNRPTEDVDLFTNIEGAVVAAAGHVEAALRQSGITVVRVEDESDLTSMIYGLEDHIVEWELHRDNRVIKLSLAFLDRRHSPIAMDVGPVMDLADLLAWKVSALVNRARERDYIDVAAVLDEHSPEDLIAMARCVDAGLESEDIPRVGHRLDRLPDEAFLPYGLSRSDVSKLRDRFAIWPRQTH